jgi:O-antigen/teichoic acid export membrane protein
LSSLASSSAIYMGSAALNAAVPFVVLPLLARWLGPAAFGVVGSYLALVNICTVLAGLGTHGVISVVHFKQDPRAVPAHVVAALRLLLASALPLIALLWLFGAPLERATAVPAAWIWTAGRAATGQFVVTLALAVLQARGQALQFGALQVSLTLGWGLLSLLFIGGLGLGWTGRVLGQLAAVAAAAALALWWLGRDCSLRAGSGPAPLAALLRFGVPLLPHSLAAVAMASADRLLLGGLAGAQASGQYFAAFQIAAVLTVAAAGLNQAWVPWLYRRLAAPDDVGAREVVRATYAIYGLLLGGAALLALSAAWLVPLIAGAQYRAAAALLPWLAPAAAMSGMYYFVTNYLFYAGRTGLLSGITVGCSVLQLALMLWLIPRWGAQGAAAAVLASATLYWLAVWIAAQRVWPMPWRLQARGAAA